MFLYFSVFTLTMFTTGSISMANPLPSRIDVHSHFIPPNYREALANNGHSHPDGMPSIPEWSPSEHLAMMKIANVSKSILSISSPGTHIVANNIELGVKLTRECNAYAAYLKRTYPEKFGFWASLPLPDVECSLEEIDTARYEAPDGFALMTNYHGLYLGDPAFDRVFEKLNELGATVFIHPTKPCVRHGEGMNAQIVDATPFGEQYPVPIFEFFFDTARAVINLFSSGTVDRCPNITFIIPHAGGALPPLLTRFMQFSTVVPGGRALDVDKVQEQLEKQFYFDLAGFVFDGESGGQGQLKAFVDGFDISHERLLYGSDFPFTQTQFVEMLAKRMKDGLEHLYSARQRNAIYEENAGRLLEKKGTQ